MKQFLNQTKKAIFFLIFNLLAVVLLVALCEGLSSLTLLWQAVAVTPPIAERSHTQYDPDLGWVNIPNTVIEDMYGPGIDLRINSQGFRATEEFSPAVPDGKLRVICSGDSFTLGYGVSNQNNWCQLLAAADSRLQTVNMGQGGYGIDQAYLWYKRDGISLDHNIHLFAFITRDFERMQEDNFLGYGKPLLAIENNRLVVTNTPVPQRAFYLPWVTENRESIRQLRSVQLFERWFQPAGQKATAAPTAAMPAATAEQVAARLLIDLKKINAQKNSTLILVYLPAKADYASPYPPSTERWREKVYIAAHDLGLPLIDLVADFRQLPPEQVQTFFLTDGEVNYLGAAGHYSVAGNQYVAQRIHKALISLTDVSDKLAALEPLD